ncbi:unnamed protein product [Trichogramma brassicae]|uniref:Uncharacterized protein n=1 Tax=Trichogramma brassicae TaxID=86971 RepID=A0A6H5I841_9HYME|nr:unnamed protein product [Trichogramma brassicae]
MERDGHVYERTLRAAQRDEVTRSVAEWANALTDEQVSAELQMRSLFISPEKSSYRREPPPTQRQTPQQEESGVEEGQTRYV